MSVSAPERKHSMKPMTYLIVRKKNNPTAPLITSTPESVDLDLFDVVDEYGAPVREEVLEEIRKIQASSAQQ
jgi:hypothetical protein